MVNGLGDLGAGRSGIGPVNGRSRRVQGSTAQWSRAVKIALPCTVDVGYPTDRGWSVNG